MKFVLSFVLSAFFSVPSLGAIKFKSAVPETIKAQMLKDLELTESFEGTATSKLYLNIFGASILEGTGLNQFFEQRIKEVDMDDCGGGNSVAACVQTFVAPNTMFLSENFVKNDFPQVYRISIVFHEARHTEITNGGWPHKVCPTPYLDEQGRDIVGKISGMKMEGHDACDDIAMGAYGMQAVLLKSIQNACTNCSEKIMMDAEIFGDDTLLRIHDLGVRKLMRSDLEKK